MSDVPVSVIIPTYQRPQRLLDTLSHITRCEPQPQEVLVHIDAGDDDTAPALAHSEIPVRILHAETRAGPGGGRNRLMKEAANDLVLSLDDDSYPVVTDFFHQITYLANEHPAYSLFSLPTLVHGSLPPDPVKPIRETCAFEGGAVLMRRTAILAVPGYLPLRYAYGMEETDVVLQLLDAGFSLGRVDRPCIQHDVTPHHRTNPAVNRAWLINTALLPFLRYPWPHVLQLPIKVLRRLGYSLRAGQGGATFGALGAIPRVLWQHRHLRAPVKRSTLQRYRRLRRQ